MCVEYAKFLMKLLGCLEFLQCCTGRGYVHVWSTFSCKKTDQKQNKDRELREGVRETETECLCVSV
jgi:CRISPR/Cas system-associated protein Cas5 (RAMP superfamily)